MATRGDYKSRDNSRRDNSRRESFKRDLFCFERNSDFAAREYDGFAVMTFFDGSRNFGARGGAVVPPAFVVNHFDVAETEAFAADEHAEFDATAFDKSAVAGIEIAHKHFAGAVESDFAMDRGNGGVRNAVIVAFSAANAIGAPLQGEHSALGDT